MNNYYITYKPFNVLSQFTSHERKKTLKDFFDVPQHVYSLGRLDFDSEGLLILSNDKSLNQHLLNPVLAHEREYWVQVEGAVTKDAVNQLEKGIDINIDGKIYCTRKCKAQIFEQPPVVAERNPPIRFRKNIPESWIKIMLTEGKNRQVRKMTASVGFPTLRLIRYRIEKINIDGLQPGEMKMLSQGEMYNLLNINKK
ncbi:MAG: pseudouridine synthase [Chitinophagaceae bacterium]|nr:pseudouridine synthase [Chitinophagaceae bacterium]